MLIRGVIELFLALLEHFKICANSHFCMGKMWESAWDFRYIDGLPIWILRPWSYIIKDAVATMLSYATLCYAVLWYIYHTMPLYNLFLIPLPPFRARAHSSSQGIRGASTWQKRDPKNQLLANRTPSWRKIRGVIFFKTLYCIQGIYEKF